MRNMDIILKHILNNVFFYELKMIKPPRLYSWWFYITYKELISSKHRTNDRIYGRLYET